MRPFPLLLAAIFALACESNVQHKRAAAPPSDLEARVRAVFPKLPADDPWDAPAPEVRAIIAVFPFVAPDGGTTRDTVAFAESLHSLVQVAAPSGVGTVFITHSLKDLTDTAPYHTQGRVFPKEGIHGELARFYGATHWVYGVVAPGPDDNKRLVKATLKTADGKELEFEHVADTEALLNMSAGLAADIFRSQGLDGHPGTEAILADTAYSTYSREISKALEGVESKPRRAEIVAEVAKKYPDSLLVQLLAPGMAGYEDPVTAVTQFQLKVPGPGALPYEWYPLMTSLGESEELRPLQLEVLQHLVAAMPNNGSWSRHMPYPGDRFTGTMDEARLLMAKKWYDHSAKTPQQTAWLGSAFVECAYQYRGGGFIDEVTDLGIEKMEKLAPEGGRLLKAAIDDGIAVPWVVEEYITATSLFTYPFASMPEFNRCVANYPHAFGVWQSMMDKHRPRWSANPVLAGPFLHRMLDESAGSVDMLFLPMRYFALEAYLINDSPGAFSPQDLDRMRAAWPWVDGVLAKNKKRLREEPAWWTDGFCVTFAYYTRDLALAVEAYERDPDLIKRNGWPFFYGKSQPLQYLARALAETGDWAGVATVTAHVTDRKEAGDDWATKMDPLIEGDILALAAIAHIIDGKDAALGLKQIDELVAHPTIGIGWDTMAMAYLAADERGKFEALLKRMERQQEPSLVGVLHVARAYSMHLGGDAAGARRELDNAIANHLRPQSDGDLAVPMARIVEERLGGRP
ncbi:MAG: hypothetical protein SF028_04865 [Candidatus Sumerlaeia bacterium]|nr:hypothetical protein [Candidatus Sumerlaeia bacterium]